MSHNRNPSGRNQYGPVVKADDPLLKCALEKYHREGITNDIKISERLRKDYDIRISEHTVKRRRRELSLVAGRYAAKELTYQEMAQYVLEILDEDKTDSWGVENVKARIAHRHMVHIPKPIISDIMHMYAPDGFENREPGAKRIARVRKAPLGIHERWAADGHDKLYGIGFPVWAIVDDATGKWLGAWVVPSNRLARVVAYLFLDTVERFKGIPLQVSTDCGSETTLIYGFANALRRAYHPDIDADIIRAHEYVRSVHNISVERSWLRLRLDWGNNAVEVFHEGIHQGIYQPTDEHHYELVQWLWSKLLQQELNQFTEFRNGVRMRKDSQKAGPSGMSRNEAFTLYESWGGRDSIPDCTPIQDLKEELGGKAILEFVTVEYAARCQTAYHNLGITQLSFQNVWTVFQDLYNELYN